MPWQVSDPEQGQLFYHGDDPDVINAIRFWHDQGNYEAVRQIVAAGNGDSNPSPPDINVSARAGGIDAPMPGAPPASPPPTPPASPTDPGPNADAVATIKQIMHEYGLDELGDWVWRMVTTGASQSQIELALYDTTNEAGKVVDRLYPELKIRRDAGLPPLSIGDAVGYRNTAIQLFRAAGLPVSFYDQPSDLGNFIGKDVSLTELKARIDDAQVAAFQAPQETRDALQRLYGVGPGDLTAYWLDPGAAEPILHQRLVASQLAGTAAQTGYGALDQTQAERLAALGITQGQAQQGFSQLGAESQLFTPLPGSGETGMGTDAQLAAAFGGEIAAQQAIQRRQAERVAAGHSGGEFATGRTGTPGLGSANT